LLLALGVAWHPAVAHAQAPLTDPKDMAAQLGTEALALYQKGRFADAYDKFEQAERAAHSPVFLVWMARSKRALGGLVRAKELYARVAAESPRAPADASANWQRAYSDAQGELDVLSARIPHVIVRLSSDAPPGVRAEMDGAAIPVGQPIETDPGEHIVRATAGERATFERRVRLEEGQAPLAVDVAFPSPVVHRAEPRTTHPFVGLGVASLGVGAAGVTAGAITGLYAQSLARQVDSGCIGGGATCLASDRGKADSAQAYAVAFTVCFIAGGAIAALGVVLLFVRREEAPATVSVGPAGASVTFDF
jgi:hypothetical protein